MGLDFFCFSSFLEEGDAKEARDEPERGRGDSGGVCKRREKSDITV